MPDDLAEQLIEREDYAAAAERLESLLARKEDPGLRMRLATCAYRMGKFSDALVHARRCAEEESPHRADALMMAGFCLKSLKRYREASRFYLEFAEKYPSESRVRIARFSAALCLEELDDWPGAVAIYRALNDDEAEFRLAICLERSGKPDEAAQIFEAFAAKYGDSPERLKVSFRLGSMRLRQGRFDEATRHLQYVLEHGKETFIGSMAAQLIERARVKQVETARKLKKYS